MVVEAATEPATIPAVSGDHLVIDLYLERTGEPDEGLGGWGKVFHSFPFQVGVSSRFMARLVSAMSYSAQPRGRLPPRMSGGGPTNS